jgi:hypothetical protein
MATEKNNLAKDNRHKMEAEMLRFSVNSWTQVRAQCLSAKAT